MLKTYENALYGSTRKKQGIHASKLKFHISKSTNIGKLCEYAITIKNNKFITKGTLTLLRFP